jgi:hypothetical protein
MSDEEMSWEPYMLSFHTQQLRDMFHYCAEVDVDLGYYDVLLCNTIFRNDNTAS